MVGEVINQDEVIVKLEDKFTFHCPGCGCLHFFVSDGPQKWNWNGDKIKPTVTPSIHVQWGSVQKPNQVCHFFITEGTIQFCGDSTHELACKTVPMIAR